MDELARWVGILGPLTAVAIWLLTRRSSVTDRLAQESAQLAGVKIQAEQKLIENLQERLDSQADENEELRERLERCGGEKETIRREMRLIRDYCQRQNWPLPEIPPSSAQSGAA